MPQLPVCQHCHKQWTYGQTLRNSFLLRCPYCKNRNYARKFSRGNFMFSLIAAVIILFILPSLGLSKIVTFLLAALAVMIYTLIAPFNLELSKDEKPFF